jgi:hypothetical protein
LVIAVAKANLAPDLNASVPLTRQWNDRKPMTTDRHAAIPSVSGLVRNRGTTVSV